MATSLNMKTYGGYGVEVTRQFVALKSRVQFPVAAPKKKTIASLLEAVVFDEGWLPGVGFSVE